MNNAQPEKPITTSDKCSNVNSMAEKLSQLEKDFPNWNNLYNTQKIETMPWCNENLDYQFPEALHLDLLQIISSCKR
jgi:hypothetical protein